MGGFPANGGAAGHRFEALSKSFVMKSVGVHGFLGPSIAPKRRGLRLCSAHDDRFSDGTSSRMVCFSIGRWRSHGRHRCRSAFSATPHPLVHSGNHQRPREDTHGHPKLQRSKNLLQVPGPALRKYSSLWSLHRAAGPCSTRVVQLRTQSAAVFRPGYTRI